MKPTDPLPSSSEETITATAAVAESIEPPAPVVAPLLSSGALSTPAPAAPRIVSGVSLAPTVRLRHYYRWRGWVAPKLF
jgi:hypothetical protein